MEQKLTYNLAVRLFSDEKCFGPGVAQLLHRVQELHSLRAAAMSMNMAYSKAWTITKHAQAALGFPLLHSITGGRGGGGAELTDDCSAVERLGKEVYLTPGWRGNIKITTASDLTLAEALLRERENRA